MLPAALDEVRPKFFSSPAWLFLLPKEQLCTVAWCHSHVSAVASEILVDHFLLTHCRARSSMPSFSYPEGVGMSLLMLWHLLRHLFGGLCGV